MQKASSLFYFFPPFIKWLNSQTTDIFNRWRSAALCQLRVLLADMAPPVPIWQWSLISKAFRLCTRNSRESWNTAQVVFWNVNACNFLARAIDPKLLKNTFKSFSTLSATASSGCLTERQWMLLWWVKVSNILGQSQPDQIFLAYI